MNTHPTARFEKHFERHILSLASALCLPLMSLNFGKRRSTSSIRHQHRNWITLYWRAQIRSWFVWQFIITVVLLLWTGNLTCGTSDANYRTFSRRGQHRQTCTSLAWEMRDSPERVQIWRSILAVCPDNGRTAAYRIEFELRLCNRSNSAYLPYMWLTYHSCCYSTYVCFCSFFITNNDHR